MHRRTSSFGPKNDDFLKGDTIRARGRDNLDAIYTERKMHLLGIQGFDHWVLGSGPQLSVRSKAQAEQLQMHTHHFAR